jgi:catalase
MPLPANEATVENAKELITTLKGIFGTPPGFRPGTSHPLPD